LSGEGCRRPRARDHRRLAAQVSAGAIPFFENSG